MVMGEGGRGRGYRGGDKLSHNTLTLTILSNVNSQHTESLDGTTLITNMYYPIIISIHSIKTKEGYNISSHNFLSGCSPNGGGTPD